MPKYLSICTNGAVALGAFEAGVVAQIYADVCELNSKGSEILIDAVAGASAGAVTSVLLCQAIAAISRPEEFSEVLSAVWIDGISLLSLIGDSNNPSQSLFDPGCLQTVAKKVIKDEADFAGIQSPPVVLSLALTNIDGIPYQIPVDGPPVVSHIFADYETVLVEDGLPSHLSNVESLADQSAKPLFDVTWAQIQGWAITSAAFPFAFQSHVLERDLSHYPTAICPDNGETKVKFNYVDGGVLDNNPIGRAIDAASYQEQLNKRDFKDRSFIVIEPDPLSVSQAKDALTALQANLPTEGVSLLALAGKLVNTYFNSSLYRDLEEAEKTNTVLAALDNLVEKGVLSTDQLKQVLEASNLHYKKQVAFERIVPNEADTPLCGAFAGHFGGFFKREYQAFDFYLGCKTARSWVIAWAKQNIETPLQSPELERPKPDGFPGIAANDLTHIKDAIADRVKALAKLDLKIKGPLELIDPVLLDGIRFFARKELDNVLK